VYAHYTNVTSNKCYTQSTHKVESVLQCVAVCCSVLQCVAVCCSVLQCVASVLHWALQPYTGSVAVCCSELQCVAMCCSVLQVCCTWRCSHTQSQMQPYIESICGAYLGSTSA